jgi:magnesium chelatase accessory protein
MRERTELPPWWPHATQSEWVPSGALRWHVQRFEQPQVGASSSASRPCAVLIHGTGSALHTWRTLAPLLAERFEVLTVDLPGHGFTHTPAYHRLDLPSVAADLDALLQTLAVAPALLVGHSAGAAVAMRWALDRDGANGRARTAPARPMVVAINGALVPLQGPAGRLFLPAARTLSASPLVASMFAAWAALPGMTARLLQGTGSSIDALGVRCYEHLVTQARHAGGALRLMASWDLAPLARDLAHSRIPLALLVGLGDRTLPPSHARDVARACPTARINEMPRLGHLAHEEDAGTVLSHVLGVWGKSG